jgi:hypothetical protein
MPCPPCLSLQIKNRLKDENVSLSLPSQRVDRFDDDVANIIGGAKKGSLTFAPEAGECPPPPPAHCGQPAAVQLLSCCCCRRPAPAGGQSHAASGSRQADRRLVTWAFLPPTGCCWLARLCMCMRDTVDAMACRHAAHAGHHQQGFDQ